MESNMTHKPYMEEDEIDLRELGRTIWRYKWGILFFTIVITTLAVLFALSKPNEYESKTLLMPQESAKPSIGGGLAALAGMAGVDVGGGGSPGPEESFNALLSNYDFMKSYVEKYRIYERLESEESKQNHQFAMGDNRVYKFLEGSVQNKENNISKGEQIYNTVQTLSKTITIAADKKSAIITLSAKHPDPYLAKFLVESFLNYASNHLKSKEMKDNRDQIEYYNRALRDTNDIALKVKLAELASALMQKKILSDVNEFYNVKQFTAPEVPYVKDKVGPKRALIVVVALVTSLILGIFLVFFIEFIRNNKKESLPNEIK